LDVLDAKILRELSRTRTSSPFASSVSSLRKIAQALQVDKESVRLRLTALQERHVLFGWHAMINPSSLALKARRVWVEFSSEADKEVGVRKLTTIPYLRAVYDYIGNSASFIAISGREEPLSLEGGPFGELPPFKKPFVATIRFPPTEDTLSETDWKVYRAIRGNPQISQKTISQASGLSVRTIKRRLGRMIEKGVVFVAPNVDITKLEGVATDLLVKSNTPIPSKVQDEILAAMGDSIIRAERFEEPCMLFTLVTDNAPKAIEVRESVRKIVGRARAELYLHQNVINIREPLSVASDRP